MAANTTPYFYTARHIPMRATAVNMKVDGSVAGTTVVTGDADGSELTGMRVRSHDSVTAGESIVIQYYNGTNRSVIGQILVTQNVASSGGVNAWEGTWFPDEPIGISATHTIEVGRTGATGVLVAMPFGGHF